MNFGDAMNSVKNGFRIHRKGWNGKGQYVELATCISYKNAYGEIVNCDHDSIGNKALAFVGTSGVQLGWLASQADMLAEDWDTDADYVDLKVQDSIIFEDTVECITRISDMVDREIRVDYSENPPVLKIDKSVAKVGDVVGVLEDGSVFVAETPHPITE